MSNVVALRGKSAMFVPVDRLTNPEIVQQTSDSLVANLGPADALQLARRLMTDAVVYAAVTMTTKQGQRLGRALSKSDQAIVALWNELGRATRAKARRAK